MYRYYEIFVFLHYIWALQFQEQIETLTTTEVGNALSNKTPGIKLA